MDTVIIIDEECHGFIGVARTQQSAIDFLYVKQWLNDETDVFCERIKSWTPIKKAYGENWKQFLKSLNLYDLNTALDGCFYFSEAKIW